MDAASPPGPRPEPRLPLGSDGYPAAGGVAHRPAGATESARANRRWWDAAAPAYLAEHGGDLGDADFLWCPEGLREADAHLLGDVRLTARRTLSVEGAEALREGVREAVTRDLPNLALTLEVESDVRAADLVERVHAAAARYGLVRDLHNVTVEREGDGSLHLIMDAKLPGHISLREATGISAGLEAALRQELPEASRIDIHLEPLEPNLVRGEDVTERRADLARRVREVVEGHPDVLRLRDLELSARNGAIYAHVVAEMAPGTSLESAHAVETQLEEQRRTEVPDLEDVVARVTA